MTITLVNESNFESEVFGSQAPVLMDFYAEWCGPCKQLTPIVEEIAREYEGKLKVVKVDIDKSQQLAMMLRIQSVPTLLVLHERQLVARHSGLIPKQTIVEMFEALLPASAAEVTPAELAQMLARKGAQPVDIRDENSYRRAHIPGATHLLERELEARRAELRPTDGRLRVLYARSTEGAREAAEQARDAGVDVAFLNGGFLHWEADGLEIERSS